MRCNNILDNEKIRQGKKNYAGVVSGRLDLSTEKLDSRTQNNDEVNFVTL